MLSAAAARHLHSQQNVGPLTNFTHFGQSGEPGDGPYIQLWFNVENGIIIDAAYRSNGCFTAIATGSAVAEVLINRDISKVRLLDRDDIAALVGGLSPGKGYCANMAVTAIQSAFQENL